jgi:hypothetical protein
LLAATRTLGKAFDTRQKVDEATPART